MSSQALPAHAKHLFRYLFEHASLGIAVEDLDGRLLLANPALCSDTGISRERTLRHELLRIWPIPKIPEMIGLSFSSSGQASSTSTRWKNAI